MTADPIFERRLYTVAEVARYVGMSPLALNTWADRGYKPVTDVDAVDTETAASKTPLVTILPLEPGDSRCVPFIGLVEAAVVQAFCQTGVSTPRLRRALEAVSKKNDIDHLLASRRFCSRGARMLYDYAQSSADKQISLLTVMHFLENQTFFHDKVERCLKRIKYGHTWATGMILPVTERPLLRVVPDIQGGEPLFVNGGAPLSVVRSRLEAGEPVKSVAHDYDVPAGDITEAIEAVWSTW